MKQKMKLYTVRLPEEVITDLRKAAKAEHVTDQCFVINALRAGINKSKNPEPFEGSDI